MSGIYIHIPFCRQACNYCDFYFSTNVNNKQELVQSILKETAIRSSYLTEPKITSIYFGGGTPSLLSPQEIASIFMTFDRFFSWEKDIEITLEVNPDDINRQSLQDWRDLGINRLSIGLQSFNDEELKWMNRAHNAGESLSSVKLAQDYGFGNISIDLIYGSRFQTAGSWENTLEQAIALQTQHISAYNLTIENKTVLGLKRKKGLEPAVDDELSSQQFLMMIKMLEEAQFIQYEISNFGKKDFFAVHNSNYWRQQSYLGLGPSAHSYNGLSRQWNIRNNSAFIKAIADGSDFFEKEELELKDRYNEYVLTRLRTIWGCDLNEIKVLFGDKIYEHFVNAIKHKTQYLEEKKGIILLNNQGKLRADGIASDLFL